MVEKHAPFTRGIPTDNWSDWANEFNSMKYLMWRTHIEHIIKGDFLPPYMVDIDPSNVCNYDNCIWCNSKTFRHQHNTMMPMGHLFKLADFLREWGVKSACISGGGEPMTHPEFAPFLWHMYENGLKTGVISNGSLLDYEKALAIVKCSSWCGFSVDASTKEVFSRVHGVKPSFFNQVVDNFKLLVDTKNQYRTNLEITFKFLLHPYNAHEILDAVLLAKELGCNTFHLRPVCWDNLYGQPYRDPIDYKKVIEDVNNQIIEAQKQETKDFKFFGIRHKFNPDFSRKVNFKRCLATPMMTTFGADGNVHLCFDCRGRPDWVLCSHIPNPKQILDVWGKTKHKAIIDGIDPNKCPRCTFGTLNEIIEKVFIEDKMFKDFL